MSIERFLLVNFTADLLLLMVCARAVGRVRPMRLCLAALVGATYAILSYLPGFAWLNSPVCVALCPILLSVIACSPGSTQKYLRMFLYLLVCTGMAGGVQMAFNRHEFSAPFFLATVLIFLLHTDSRRRMREMSFVHLRITLCGKRIPVYALLDSGNCLHEPLSGLPVLIIARDYLTDKIGERTVESLQKRSSLVRYRSIDSCGEMPCLPVDRLEMLENSHWKAAGDVYLAISDHSFSGEHQAIAPVGIYDEA